MLIKHVNQGVQGTVSKTTNALGKGDVKGTAAGLSSGVGNTVGGVGKVCVSRNPLSSSSLLTYENRDSEEPLMAQSAEWDILSGAHSVMSW